MGNFPCQRNFGLPLSAPELPGADASIPRVIQIEKFVALRADTPTDFSIITLERFPHDVGQESALNSLFVAFSSVNRDPLNRKML